MRVKVRLLYCQGRLATHSPGAEPPRHVGELSVSESRDLKLERTSLRARLLDATRGTGADVLPELYDARLIWLQGNQWRITGYERIDDVAYAQTWAVEVA